MSCHAPTVRVLLLLVAAVAGARLVAADAAPDQKPAAVAATPPLTDPDAEGIATDGETSARFFFKKNRNRYNRRYPNYDYNYYYDYNNYDYNNYDYNSQCQSCGYGAVDYTTARSCCQRGYQRCCFNNNGSEKPGSCPSLVYGSGVGSSTYCRQECYRDSDCYGAQKCCTQGCSRTCRSPSTGYEKPGTCPYPGSAGASYPSYPYHSGGGGSRAYCRRDCYSDQQCPGSQKCCETNCSATCVQPQRYY
ncbi:WAP four-disulfide core domain protein 2 [Amphibalanus amphitrite]|uniref:WAP four-disulfide core domain protein 2 n=1 Tax=Amphibalanus amphitrite TaxID=1232801 RepID=A0A6A4XAJ7_AMPAM|nr:WAP four-disulfide core domain protein 2 [Amphibalanus amphitrite]